GGGFPTNSSGAANYWVDVVFAGTTPSVSRTGPPSAAAGVSTTVPSIAATFNEPVLSRTISFVLKDSGGNTVAANFAYDSFTNTATLTPLAPLAASTTYMATISGLSDSLGDLMTSPYSWSFTTATPDTSPPAVTSITPASGAAGVSVAGNLSATFD